MKHNLLKSVIISVILLMGVSNAWAWTSRQTGTISSVYVTGSMNSWDTDDQDWKLSSIDGNHWKGTFYLKGQTSNYTFKLYINAKNRNDYYSTGYNYHKDWTGGEAPIYTDKENASITPRTTTTTKYIKVEIDFYASYGNDDHGYLSVTQTDVSDLSPSLDATSMALIAGGTSTLTASCSGGSGGYTYSYQVTCDGNDVTNSTLNAKSGSSVKFTAPTVTGKKTYTIKVTAKDSHALLSGLATKTATKTITVEEAHNVTISYKCGSTTVKNNTTTNNVKFETKSTITAPDIPGYKFANWTLGTGIASSEATTANPIKITTKSSGNHTLTANYTENTFVVRGGVKFGDTWSKDTHVMTKKNASEKIVYYTITLDGTNNIDDVSNSQFQFKIYEKERDKWYGLTADGDQYWYTRGMDAKSLDGNNATSKNIEIRADVKGDYEIKVDYSDPNSSPKITVTYPQKPYYLAGTWDNWVGESPIENTPVTIYLEKGEYSFLIFNYQKNAEYYGNTGKMERTKCSGWTMTNGANDCRIVADLSGNYTFTFDKSTKKLTVTYPTAYKMTFGIDNAAHGTLKVQINYENVTESGKYWYPGTKFVFSYEINKGYLFKGWNTKQNGTGEWLSTDITYTHTLTEDATVYAIFEDGYHITVGNTKYYLIDHNGKQINKLYIELGANTTYNSPLYKGTTKVDNGGTYTSTVAGTYTCELNNTTSPTGVNWTPPYAHGDYRLLYIEQEVGLEGGLPTTTITYSHPSDIVRKSNTSSENVVSLHIFNKMDGSMDAGGKLKTGLNSPEIILQQYNASNDTWEDIACHMIFGPLRAGFMHAGMPGRKNASTNSSIDDLLYDNGIEVIKNDQIDNGSGVWDFTIYQDGTTATLDLTDRGLKRYTGKYYIRTSAAKGQWSNYTIPENEMTESTYASDHFRLNNPYHEENEYFTHYFCEYVNKTITSNVKFVVANEHGMAISKEFTKDDFTDAEGNLAGANTNVRWSWNQITNKCKRAYIAGSFDGDNEFLVVKKENNNVELQPNTNGKTGYFNDNTNWLYYADIKSKPLAKVQVAAKYNDKYQYFMGAENGENQYEQLIGGTSSDTKYPVRIIYDFKEHRFVVAYLPQNTITGDVAIETSVMLLRTNHGETNQIALNNNERITAPVPAYGAITFTEQHLTGSGSQYEKMLYWVSFPFDVALPDVFGLGKYGTDWIMEYYDGNARSITGLTTYNTFWKYITDETETLKAGVGYVLCLNVNKVNEHFLDANNKNEEVTLYFPSKESIPWGDITKQGEKTISLTPTTNSVSSETDHNWHLIGVPSYANTGESANTTNTDFLYQYDATDNSYDAKASEGVNFQALHAYMVQHAGNITWTNYIAPSPIAARNNTDAVTHTLRLELQDNGSYADQTFIKLTDEENPTLDFDMNRDLPKIINTGANVYSLIQERNIQLAGNVMPVANTTIPLGVVIAAAGEYTFAMPDGTDGIMVELIDYEANTTTNLLFNDYTISLPKGTFENRFALSVKPDKTATSLENIFNEATGNEVKKFIIDGVLYMQKDGVLYDAQGHIVR